MKAHELIRAISPELYKEIISYLQTETKEAFRTALVQVAAQRKFRPQFVQQKTREQQAQWLSEHLRMKLFDGVAEQMIQLWLLKAKTPMLTAFLDGAEIKHDGKGQVDDLPEEITAKQAKAGIDAMLKDNPAEQVALYLNIFQNQRPDGWKAITDIIEKNDDLKLVAKA
jgi:hypothetical protein